MGSAFHQLCPRYSGALTLLPLRLLGYGKPLPFLPVSDLFSESELVMDFERMKQDDRKKKKQQKAAIAETEQV